jgi:predicted dehydrogenase
MDVSDIYALRHSRNGSIENGVKNIYGWDEIPADIDFAIVSNPTSEHLTSIQSLLKLKLPLFIEKPLLASTKYGERLISDIKISGIQSYVACNMRFHPVIKFLKQHIGSKRLIEYTSYCGSFLPNWRQSVDYRDSYSAKSALGGGVHLDLIHELDFCTYLLGAPKDLKASFGEKSTLEINTVDVAHYTLDYPSFMAFITLNYYRRDSKRTIELVWEDETWIADLLTCTVHTSAGETLFKEEFNIMKTYEDQMDYFINGITGDLELMNDAEEGYQMLKLCLNE